jgi:hypothetical protein
MTTPSIKSVLSSVLLFGMAFGANAQMPDPPPPVGEAASDDDDALPPPAVMQDTAGVPISTSSEATPEIDLSDGSGYGAADAVDSGTGESPEHTIDVSTSDEAAESGWSQWLAPLRVSLIHELSYKIAAPKRIVNNRSSVRIEYSKPLTDNVFFRLDTKLNLHWGNDHRARAKNENPFRELVTREAYLQTSLGETSLRFGYQILPWGVSEGGAITDEVSPRNNAEFFFIPLEESRIGQPMLIADRFGDSGQWTAFFVPRPSYNKYPDAGSEYDIPGAFGAPKPDESWSDPDDFEYGLRWKRTFGKSDFSLMAASLIDNDYLVRKQRFQMLGFTANIAVDNLLYRAEVAWKQPKVFFAQPEVGNLSIVESDQLDSSLGFDYSPGGRPLTYSAEVTWSHLLNWQASILGRKREEYSLVGSISNQFLNNDLMLTWLSIYSKSYRSYQHKFLGSYKIDDNSTFYLELFYPDERDPRSGTWPYRDQKQIVLRYQYQF